VPTTADVKQKYDLQGQVIERDYLWVTGVENTYSWEMQKGSNVISNISPYGGLESLIGCSMETP